MRTSICCVTYRLDFLSLCFEFGLFDRCLSLYTSCLSFRLCLGLRCSCTLHCSAGMYTHWLLTVKMLNVHTSFSIALGLAVNSPLGLQLQQLLPRLLCFCLVCDLLPLQATPSLLLQTLCFMSDRRKMSVNGHERQIGKAGRITEAWVFKAKHWKHYVNWNKQRDWELDEKKPIKLKPHFYYLRHIAPQWRWQREMKCLVCTVR